MLILKIQQHFIKRVKYTFHGSIVKNFAQLWSSLLFSFFLRSININYSSSESTNFYNNIVASMKGQQSYLSTIRSSLQIALCLRDFPSTLFEKDNKPYVELTGYTNKIDSLIVKPIYLARNKKEQFLIQPSINSCRISFTLKKNDEIDKLISNKFSAMAAARAEAFEVMRRKPLKDYDVTMLITNEILEKYNKDFIIELILNLVGTLEKDLLQIKLNINTQCRIAATYFIEQISNPPAEQYW